MPLIINTNVSSLTAQRHLGNNTSALTKSMEKLASGFRINRAGDDAAGLQLSENLRAQIRGSQKALANVQDGMNMLNIADGVFQTVQDNLQRVRELTVQAANDTYNQAQRNAIVNEIEQLLSDIDRMAAASEFNGVKLLDGSVTPYDPVTNPGGGFFLQIGANGTPTEDRIDIAAALSDMNTVTGMGFTMWDGSLGSLSITSNADAQAFLAEVDAAITYLNTNRGNLGAYVNRLEGAANNLSIAIENLSSSESRIRNVDVAAESATLVRNQILQQASNTILAQANQAPGLALKLLQG